MRWQVWRYFFVQRMLPVEALSNGLNDQITIAQRTQVLVIVGRLNQQRIRRATQRRWLHFAECRNGAVGDGGLIGLTRTG